jgi:4-amino-4-deoxy-L-arabinose transferase-like glycosyltransferase
MPISLIKRTGTIKAGTATDAPRIHRSSTTLDTSKHLTLKRRPLIEALIVIGLAMVALVPRIMLALQLDLVTDEAVYITAGKLYISQLRHFDILGAAWSYNYEHPPFVKLLIGLSVSLNALSGHPLSELLAARIPSIASGTLLIIAVYWLGREPFGHSVALLAALCLAVSPWLAYFSALAYLDMTTTTLITMAFLLLPPAQRQPRLYLLIGLLVGLALDSKYTASLMIPGMLVFVAYYTLFLRTRLLGTSRQHLPLFWWLAAGVIAAAVFFMADPAIWPHPLHLLMHSFRFEWDHSAHGHLTFIAGQYDLHVPGWTVLYVLFVKISIFTFIPAACFLFFSVLQSAHLHLRSSQPKTTSIENPSTVISRSLLVIWLISGLGMFSLLDIAVGTHYFLPMAPPLALAGAMGLAQLFCVLATISTKIYERSIVVLKQLDYESLTSRRFLFMRFRTLLSSVLLVIILVVPQAIGLCTVYGAEGYTSEVFKSEDTLLQVAYPGYREALQWLAEHTDQPANIGLVALSNTLENSGSSVSWFRYNSNLPKRFKLTEVHPGDYNFPYDYLIWPMHLQQRGYTIPAQWHRHIVHTITGGDTIYCYILARNTTTIILFKDDIAT